MIIAIVRYKLPEHIDREDCRRHFHTIAPGFADVPGLISKHFICADDGWAGGVYQWRSREDAESFYSGPWLSGIVSRYGMEPEISYFDVFAHADNARDAIDLYDSEGRPSARSSR